MTIEDWKRDSGAAGNDQFAFVSDGQDVEAVKLHLGTVAEEFDSFFLRSGRRRHRRLRHGGDRSSVGQAACMHIAHLIIRLLRRKNPPALLFLDGHRRLCKS